MDSTDRKLSLDSIEDVAGGTIKFDGPSYQVQHTHKYICTKCQAQIEIKSFSRVEDYTLPHEGCPMGDGELNYVSSEVETVPV